MPSETIHDHRTERVVFPADRHSWEWLAGFARRLGLSVDLVDDQAEPLLPEGLHPEGDRIRRLLRSEPEALKSGVREALAGTSPALAVIARQAVAFLALATKPRYVLVIARPAAQTADQLRQIQAIGPSLAAAVEAQLNNAHSVGQEVLDRLPALQRVLARASSTGRERDVVRAFAEALAIWEDIEVRGYVENVNGVFVLDVMLPGSLRSEAALLLDRDVTTGEAPFVRLQPADAERLGFTGASDVLVSLIGSRWQVALSGRIPRTVDARIVVYADLLAGAVERAAGIAVSRATWSMFELLVGAAARTDVEETANRVLDIIRAEFKAAATILVVSVPGNGQVLAAGDTAPFDAQPEGPDRSTQLTFSGPVGTHYRMTLGVTRDAEPFNRPEEAILAAIGRLLTAWLPSALAGLPQARDRRNRALRPIDLIERQVRTILDSGDQVALVVVNDPGAAFQPDRIRQSVAAIRGQIRPGDVAAAIDEHEIAVLLPSTDKESAAIVVDRLQHDVMTTFGARWQVGVAARASGQSNGSLVEAARRDAQFRAGVSNS